tara:strand:+ start:889 stop:1602 length:714 start_codon:yes stop_codon:yes gene_type:complete
MSEDAKSAHEIIANAAKTQGATASALLHDSVSRHDLPTTVSFTNLAAIHSAVKEANKKILQLDFVATSGKTLVFSSKFNFVSTAEASSESGSRKRRRDDHEDAVIGARRRLAKNASNALPADELDVAQEVLTKMVTGLRGPSGEILVQSFAMLSRKLNSTDERPRVLLAMRINAGIPIPVSQLKRCLGPCWRDGVLSTESSINGVCDSDLPLSEEGAASMEQGNLSMLVVTSVPAVN